MVVSVQSGITKLQVTTRLIRLLSETLFYPPFSCLLLLKWKPLIRIKRFAEKCLTTRDSKIKPFLPVLHRIYFESRNTSLRMRNGWFNSVFVKLQSFEINTDNFKLCSISMCNNAQYLFYAFYKLEKLHCCKDTDRLFQDCKDGSRRFYIAEGKKCSLQTMKHDSANYV